MVRITSSLGLVLMAAVVAVSGCATAGEKSAQPESDRARAVAKLSTEEIIQSGDAAAKSGDFGRAMNFYQQALEIEPTAALWFRIGWIYAELERKGQAAQAYVAAIALDPEHVAAHEELALLLLENRQREEAAVHFARAAELDPQRWRSHNALGVLADAAGKHATAVAHLEAALAAQPGSPIVLNNLGYSYYLAGDLQRAGELYAEALTTAPEYRPAITNVGLLHARQGRYETAVETLATVMEKHRACNDVGYIAFQNGDLDTAERLLNQAIRLSPSWYATAQDNLRRVRDARARESGDS